MKSLYFGIIIGAGIVMAISVGVFLFVYHNNTPMLQLQSDQIQNNSKFYTLIDTPGLTDTYNTYQKIHFSVIVHGYGLYPCVIPDVTIYNDKSPNEPVYRENQGILSCKAFYNPEPENFTIHYQEPDHPYITSINKTGNYTIRIAVGDTSIQKKFSVVEGKYIDWSNSKPANELYVEDFRDTCKAGEKIIFTVVFKGMHSCGSPSFAIQDTANKIVWESPFMLVLCDPDTEYIEQKWKFGDLYNVTINQTGKYHILISFSDKTIEKKFAIIPGFLGSIKAQ